MKNKKIRVINDKRYRMMVKVGVMLFMLHLALTNARAQQFFNLTASEVRIDSLLPVFCHHQELGRHYDDSIYTVSIEYPEFIPMSDEEVARYQSIADEPLPELPEIMQLTTVERKRGWLHLSMVPLVCRNGRYQKLVSFMLKVTAKAKEETPQTARARQLRRADATQTASRYADNSVLQTGSWAKIRVSSTGIFQLTSDFIRQAGFSDLNRVKIYGYGGAMQPERLTGDYLAATDDLKELPTCNVDGRRLFYGQGPVSWDTSHKRVRNPYSDYGYYFLTESDEAPQTIDRETFLATYYPLDDAHGTLYEVDNYAWFHGGRNLYDATVLTNGSNNQYTLGSNAGTGTVTVSLSAAGAVNSGGKAAQLTISVNGKQLGTMNVQTNGSLEKMRTSVKSFTTDNLQTSNQITIAPNANCGTVRLDYISIYADQPKEAPNLAQTFPTPEYLYHITNQNHHAAPAADMVIIIPTSQKLLTQAERLKTLHEQRDGLRVTIVPADELFNEFSSGTPDANAYRRYLKMLYDRAEDEADMPRYLLLLGDGAWDNRMRLSDWSSCSPDDFLLCYESENSYSEVECFVSDDYFCLMDDGEGTSMLTNQSDVAVGRIPARTADEAAGVVDKIERYVKNEEAGAWQNVICFMGDDGNQNQHMNDADSVAQMVEKLYPNYVVKRIMWDAYNRVSSSTGNTYPDVTRLIKQQMQQGALLMNYSGHGGPTSFSHEYVVQLPDFQEATSPRLPLWMTASCDLMPFDGQEDNIGEATVFNKKGGGIAFYGTTRTVYQNYNRLMNLAFTQQVLSRDKDGKAMPIGEAARLAKNQLISPGIKVGKTKDGSGNLVDSYSKDASANKRQYTLLGDPALRLAFPTVPMKVETINGTAFTDDSKLTLKAGSTAKVTGCVTTDEGQCDETFNGTMTAVVRDIRELITCKLNNTGADGAEVPFTYYDRPNTVFSGSTNVKNGRFTFSFAVPKDIKYSDLDAIINLYAVNTDKTTLASGICNSLVLNGTDPAAVNTTGPDIYCYLNSSSFTNGGAVNSTPYFVAELNDEDGINASGSGIGHDLQLIIDGSQSKTYTLNNYFQYDFGSFTHGKVGFSIPQLSYGEHKLQFRAWDILNNSSTTELTFNVVKGLEPLFFDVECTKNPATTSTSFRILHDRTGSDMDVKLDIFDTSGRHLWTYSESSVPTDQTYTIDWDLTVDGGRQLNTGLYLYRLSISSDGSTYVSKAKKLIVMTHQ